MTYLLIGQLGLLRGGAADPAFELLFDLFKQAVHAVLQEVLVVSGLIGTEASQSFESERLQLLLGVGIATSAHFLRNL